MGRASVGAWRGYVLAALPWVAGCVEPDAPIVGRMDAGWRVSEVGTRDAVENDTAEGVDRADVDGATGEILAARREACGFHAGAGTVKTLGSTAVEAARSRLRNVMVLVQENRSFDHYLGQLPASGHTDVDGLPAGYSNPDDAGHPVYPMRAPSSCAPGDPPHQWASVHRGWDDGRMDGFYAAEEAAGGEGAWALAYYDGGYLPFYYWLYGTYAMADRYFAACLSGTWANRDFLYTGGAHGVRDTGTVTIPTVRTVFDQLDDAGVAWGVYTDGAPRQDALGWDTTHRGVYPTRALFAALRDGSLPSVVFIDPAGMVDEHPVADIQNGERWVRDIVRAAGASPLWPGLALVLTYDEGGGFFDHVPPPAGCVSSPEDAGFDRRGVRVPFVVVSPWSRPGYVSHVTHDHASVLRLIQALHGLPALTNRDANADALLDLFDFTSPGFRVAPVPPPAGTNGCPAGH